MIKNHDDLKEPAVNSGFIPLIDMFCIPDMIIESIKRIGAARVFLLLWVMNITQFII